MANLNIKTGDKVVVIAGKDKGKVSTVLASFPKENKVTVKGVNVVTKHKKPKSAQDKGGITKLEAKIDASNVQVVCPICNKATRVAHKVVDGKNVRICKHCQAVLDTAKKAKKEKVVKGAEEKPAKTEKTTETVKKSPAKTTSTKTNTKTSAPKTVTKSTKTKTAEGSK